jgi:hypothetical protein
MKETKNEKIGRLLIESESLSLTFYEMSSENLPSPQRLCRNEGSAMFVILNEVKNLMKSNS